jgi:4-hydroxybenzoate polyprenyltransferase
VKEWGGLALAFFGFSLIASAVYVLNDILNREEDRLHPVKRNRPIASGRLGISGAWISLCVALAVGLGMLFLSGQGVALVGMIYFVLMIAYSIWLRELLIVDIIVVAVGFVLRVIAGSVLIHEPLSHWILLCTFAIALYLGLVKRRQEIAALGEVDATTRKVLHNYPALPIIDSWITVVSSMTLLCYALYTVDPVTVGKHHTANLIYTLPFVLYGIFRYQKLALTGRAGEDPSELVIRDTGLKVVVILWGGTVAVILALARR